MSWIKFFHSKSCRLSVAFILAFALILPFFSFMGQASISCPALKTVAKSVSPTLIADINNNPVLLQGVGVWHAVDDITLGACFRGGWGSYSSTYVNEFFSFLHSEGLNFARFQMNAYWCLTSSAYRSKLSEVLTIAETYDVYVMYDFDALAAGTWHEDGTPYLAVTMSIADFNSACATLASLCSSHDNAIIEIWNEPTFGSTTTYDLYFNNLPTTLTAIRNAGFDGIVFIMGSTALTASRYFGGDGGTDSSNDNMDWAIDHPTLFTNYGSVAADFHAYYIYLHGGSPDGYPDLLANLNTHIMTTCRVLEAQNAGIPVCWFELGVHLGMGDITNQNNGLANGLTVSNNNGLGWCAWVLSATDDFRLASSLNPITWNTQGNIVASHVVSSPPPTTGTISVSTNIVGASFTVNGASKPNPYSDIVTAGAYTIVFSAVTGYYTPATKILNVPAGGTATWTGTYSLIPVPPSPPPSGPSPTPYVAPTLTHNVVGSGFITYFTENESLAFQNYAGFTVYLNTELGTFYGTDCSISMTDSAGKFSFRNNYVTMISLNCSDPYTMIMIDNHAVAKNGSSANIGLAVGRAYTVSWARSGNFLGDWTFDFSLYIGIVGLVGIFVCPAYAIMQARDEEYRRALLVGLCGTIVCFVLLYNWVIRV